VRLQVEIDGLSQLTRQLADLVGDAEAVMTETITRVVMDTRTNAVQGIQRGPATGAVRRDGSRASAPGQFPMSDTGRLASSVEFNLPTAGRLMGEVGTNVIYGRYLEFGTSRMAARPWLLPSFEKAKVGVEARLKKAIEARI
jgi:HK97 gp10 family phage protein